MQGQRKALLLICSLLLADFGVLGLVPPESAMQVPASKAVSGTVILSGGNLDRENSAALLKRMVEIAGGSSVSLVIIPTADSRLEPATRTGSSTTLIDYEKEARLNFAALGLKRLTVLHTRDRKVADSEEFAVPLRSANCVWIPGGDPNLVFAVYPNTRVQSELQGVLNRGGVVAGDSAGAEIITRGGLAVDLSHPEKMPPLPEMGLGLLQNVLVIPHLNRYKPGAAELGSKAFVSGHREVHVLLIEENTAIMIQAEQVSRLVGTGKIGVVGSSTDGRASLLWLSGSKLYDPRGRVLVQ